MKELDVNGVEILKPAEDRERKDVEHTDRQLYSETSRVDTCAIQNCALAS